MKVYFYNIDKCSSFALNHYYYYYYFTLFVVNILFSNDIIKLKDFIKLTRVNYLNIIFFIFKNIFFFLIFFMPKQKITCKPPN